MKNILFKEISARMFVGISIFVLAFAVTGVSIVEARMNNADPVTALAQTKDNVISKLTIPALATATSTVLVDVSDSSSTNFKHIGISGLEVSQIRVEWTSDVVATTTLKFGVIASTTPAGNLVDVYWFEEMSFSTYALGTFNGRQEKILDFGTSVAKLGVASGIPTGFFTNDKDTSSSLFATTTKYASPVGLSSAGSGSLPNVGDLVMRVYDQKGTATTSVTTVYRTNLTP